MSFEPSTRYQKAIEAFTAAHTDDPRPSSTGEPYNVLYHRRLAHFCRELCLAGDNTPSEALLLAANCQHIRRWEHPRSDFSEGLVGYKTWRTKTNRWHSEEGERILLASGYDATEDADLIARFKELVTKKTLQKDDPEMQLFEDAICCVFLENEFDEFKDRYEDNEQKTIVIVQKTWGKMGPLGRGMAVKLLDGMTEREKEIIGKALAG
ncbi:hypothetical protein SAICODRAFT_5310 [Saitoella complicata NRRL Y-17804]|uniref:uncharacterized protein n=1 Tax=Saitoella complicata (strain BCRC 22490 / CBS 7301 / JCM 7358 / NBRC 10748 / NRRL Y-17804) TaxID=698492 RepID=UPI000866A48E|nr:uncharacterized protein SAICODRAFT_5310 [Saitoella complicata NRRL Y-17804]ODQ55365.1 hypothetical protein SAICODRAFT_5310 [Saitoella complicata NRRL Y-17804]